MSEQDWISKLKKKISQLPPLGYRVKLDVTDGEKWLWDGTQAQAEIRPIQESDRDQDFDTILKIKRRDLAALITGDLDATMAFMTGRLKIKGSKGVALKIGAMLEE